MKLKGECQPFSLQIKMQYAISKSVELAFIHGGRRRVFEKNGKG
jgi:hypothetical protein